MADSSLISPAEPLVPDELRALVEQADSGDPSGLPRLQQILDTEPEVWNHASVLAARVEHVWRGILSAESPATIDSVTQTVALMRQDLAGLHPTRLQQLLVDRVIGNWMEVYYLQRISADPGRSALKEECSQHLESAYKRHTAALKQLARFHQLFPEGGMSNNDMRLFHPQPQLKRGDLPGRPCFEDI